MRPWAMGPQVARGGEQETRSRGSRECRLPPCAPPAEAGRGQEIPHVPGWQNWPPTPTGILALCEEQMVRS